MKTLSFDDFDAFTDAIDGVDSKMLLRDPEQRRWTISKVDLPQLEVQVGTLASGNIACGQKTEESLIAYLPLTSGIEYRGNGTPITRSSIFVIEPGAEFCVSTKVSHRWVAVSVPVERFCRPTLDSFTRSCRVIEVGNESARVLRDTLGDVVSAAESFDGFESSNAARAADSRIIDTILQYVDVQPEVHEPQEGRPKVSRDAVVRRSLELLDARQGHYPTIAEMASASSVSERTLRSIFNQYFGVSPNRFIQLRQLQAVRQTLQSSTTGDSKVASVLAEHGVWAFGRFAARYFEQFGELPSETLRKASGS